MITTYRLEGNAFVVADNHCWIPGVYVSEKAARAACSLTPEQQSLLAKSKNGELITLEDVTRAGENKL